MQPYIPDSLPLLQLDFGKLITLVGNANAALSEYSGILERIVNPAVLLSPLTNQEAVLSSKIEGTQATLEEVLIREAGTRFEDAKNNDISEILNYRKALILAQEYLQEGRPITLNLILQLHQVLMASVRGQDKRPGEFRKVQNWIGRGNATIEEASFVPPSPLQLQDALDAWQEYISGSDFDILAQCAVMHAQFELIHPFCDGNGRIGRLLIPLFLYDKKRLSSPMFYLSGYLEANRGEYYRRLRGISQNGEWTDWIVFFLTALVEQALDNSRRVRDIMELYKRVRYEVSDWTRSSHAAALVDGLFDRPIFRVSDFSERTGIPLPTLQGLLRQLLSKEHGPVQVYREGSGRRPAIYIFPELLNICKGQKVFNEE